MTTTTTATTATTATKTTTMTTTATTAFLTVEKFSNCELEMKFASQRRERERERERERRVKSLKPPTVTPSLFANLSQSLQEAASKCLKEKIRTIEIFSTVALLPFNTISH